MARETVAFLEEQLVAGTDMRKFSETWGKLQFVLSDSAVLLALKTQQFRQNAFFIANRCSQAVSGAVLDRLQEQETIGPCVAALVRQHPRVVSGRERLLRDCLDAVGRCCDSHAVEILTSVCQYFPGNPLERELQEVCCGLLEATVITCTISLTREQIASLLDLLALSINCKTDLCPERVAQLALELQSYGRSVLLFERLFSCTLFQPGRYYDALIRLLKASLEECPEPAKRQTAKLAPLNVLKLITRQVPEALLDFELLRQASALSCSLNPEVMMAATSALGEAVCGLQSHELQRFRESVFLVGGTRPLQRAVDTLREQFGDTTWLQALGEVIMSHAG